MKKNRITALLMSFAMCAAFVPDRAKTATAADGDFVTKVDFEEFEVGHRFEQGYTKYRSSNGNFIFEGVTGEGNAASIATDPETGSKALKLERGTGNLNVWYVLNDSKTTGRYRVSMDVRFAVASGAYKKFAAVCDKDHSEIISPAMQTDRALTNAGKEEWWGVDYKDIENNRARYEYIIDLDTDTVNWQVVSGSEILGRGTYPSRNAGTSLEEIFMGIQNPANDTGYKGWEYSADANPTAVTYIDNIEVTECENTISVLDFDGMDEGTVTDTAINSKSGFYLEKQQNDSLTIETDPKTGSKALKITKATNAVDDDRLYFRYKLPQAVAEKTTLSFDVRIKTASKYFENFASVAAPDWYTAFMPRIRKNGLYKDDSPLDFDYQKEIGNDYATYKYVIDPKAKTVELYIYKEGECRLSLCGEYDFESLLQTVAFSMRTRAYEAGWDYDAENDLPAEIYIDNIKCEKTAADGVLGYVDFAEYEEDAQLDAQQEFLGGKLIFTNISNADVSVRTDTQTGKKALRIEQTNQNGRTGVTYKLDTPLKTGKYVVKAEMRIGTASGFFEALGRLQNSGASSLVNPKLFNKTGMWLDDNYLYEYKDKIGNGKVILKYEIDMDKRQADFSTYTADGRAVSKSKKSFAQTDFQSIYFGMNSIVYEINNGWESVFEDGKVSGDNPNPVMWIENISISEKNSSESFNRLYDFSDGSLPKTIAVTAADGDAVTVEKGTDGNRALKIVNKINNSNMRAELCMPSAVSSGKVKAEFDFKFENNSTYAASIGKMRGLNWRSPANICQKTNSFWKDTNTYGFVLENDGGYYHVSHVMNFDTREYTLDIFKNGENVYHFYDVNSDSDFEEFSGLLFELQDTGVCGPDEGDTVLWVDNIRIGAQTAEVSECSAGEVMSVYDDTLYVSYDQPLDGKTVEKSISVLKDGEVLDKDMYTVSYGDSESDEDGIKTVHGRIGICFVKDNGFYDSGYTVVINDGLRTVYGTRCQEFQKEFYVPKANCIYSVRMYDKFGRELRHLSDGRGREVTFRLDINDPKELGSACTAAIKDGEGKIVSVFASQNSRCFEKTVLLPENVGNDWYMELFLFDSFSGMKPYQKKEVCFRDRVVKVPGGAEELKNAVHDLATEKNDGYTGIVIEMDGETYEMKEPLVIDKDLLNGCDLPVKISGNGTVFSGKTRLDGFSPVSDTQVSQRLREDVRGRILECNLGENGINTVDALKPYGQKYVLDIMPVGVFDGEVPLTLARFPNDGYLSIGKTIERGNFSSTDENDKNNKGAIFEYSGGNGAKWQNKDDIWFFGYPYYGWSYWFARLSDVTENTVTTYHASSQDFLFGQGFYLVNILEELDREGEYYIDRQNMKLYLYPMSEEKTDISLCTYGQNIISVKGVSDITFENITFSGSRGEIACVEDSRGIVFDNCRIYDGLSAMSMTDTKNCAFVNGEIAYMGGFGISVKGGTLKTMENCDNKIVNNSIHDFGYYMTTYQPGIKVESIGNLIAHNEIFNTDHMAVSSYGNNNIYEYNDIHDCLRYASDSGAIYTGRSWISGGNVMRYNYIHDMGCAVNRQSNNAIYLDDNMFGGIIYANVFKNVETGVFGHGGRCHDIYSNIFVDCKRSVEIIHVTTSVNQSNMSTVAYGALAEKPFKDCFPELAKTIADEPLEPKYNEVYKNALVDSGDVLLDESALPTARCEDNVSVPADMFGGGGYGVGEDSPLHAEIPGFMNIEFDKIGLQKP